MSNLTSIANRLTPSVPIEITFDAQPVGVGAKKTTLFGHKAVGAVGMDYSVHEVVNVGDPTSAAAEVGAYTGVGSQIAKMAQAFVEANSIAGRSNFPSFRVVLLPSDELHFGPNAEAIEAVKGLRSDMLVSCYSANDSTNRTSLINLATLISGPDRDLQGQFGSFVTLASIDALTDAVLYAINSNKVIAHLNPDSNTALVSITGTVAVGSNKISAVAQAAITENGDTTSGSSLISNVDSTIGIQVGAAISGGGIPVGAKIKSFTANSITITALATSSNVSEVLTVQNQATAGLYEGALLTGAGIPANTLIQSVDAVSIIMSQNATAAGAAESISVQNQISQPVEIIAARCAASMMSFGQPYVPLQGVTIGGMIPSRKPSDRIQIDPFGASEAALAAGLSPLYVQPGNLVGFIRTRTTWLLKPDGVTPITSYFDYQELVALNDFREVCYAVSQNPPFNNNPGGTKASVQVAALLKDEVLREAQVFEDVGMFQGVKTLAPLFKIQPSTTSRGRFDFKIPVNVLPGLTVIAGNIQAVSDLGNFTL
jgi:hypothetical protein